MPAEPPVPATLESVQARLERLESLMQKLLSFASLGVPFPEMMLREWHRAQAESPGGQLSIRFVLGAQGPTPTTAIPEVVAPSKWNHLERRPHRWRHQLYVKDRNITVRQLVGTVKANHWDPAEAARQLDLPEAAIDEALRYAEEERDLLEFETQYEQYLAEKRGYRLASKPVPR